MLKGGSAGFAVETSMGRPYSTDLRARVLRACESGTESIAAIARRFEISESAARSWVRQLHEDGLRTDAGNLSRMAAASCRFWMRMTARCCALWWPRKTMGPWRNMLKPLPSELAKSSVDQVSAELCSVMAW